MNEIFNYQEGNLPLAGYPNQFQDEAIDAENMVIGAVFLVPETVYELILEPYHFSQKRNQIIFQAMIDLRQESRGIDMVTVVNKLGSQIEHIGGVSYLTNLSVSCPTTVHLEEYQQLVLEQYKLRELKRVAAGFLNYGRMREAESFYQTFIKLQELGITQKETKEDVLLEIFNEMFEDHGDLNGIDTGFESLNRMTSGWSNGDLIVLAGRPSMGKTAFALALAMNCCLKGGVVDVFSLEMTKKQLVKRLLSCMTRVDGSKWKNPYKFFSEEDQEKSNSALGIYHKWNLQIHDESRKMISEIRAQIQKTRREFPNEDYLVVIDYLQMITVLGKFDRHDLAIASITKELKQIARQYQVPIILLSQLSRGVEQRMDKRPKMSDLRDSGSIEQDADIIMLLYRDEYYNKEASDNKFIEIDLAKHRNGPVGSFRLLFEKEFGAFVDVLGMQECNGEA